MTEEEILVESEDGQAGVRYLPGGGVSKDGERELPNNTVEVYTTGNVELTQYNDD